MTQEPGKPPPKYRQIAADLRARIEAGGYPVGTQLPSIGELQSAYDAAKGTVDEALAILRKLGLVETRHGAGTFVLRERPGASEEQLLSEQVADLRAQVAELAERVEKAEDASLRETVSRIEANLIDLYGKTAHSYPEDEAGATRRPERVPRHG